MNKEERDQLKEEQIFTFEIFGTEKGVAVSIEGKNKDILRGVRYYIENSELYRKIIFMAILDLVLKNATKEEFETVADVLQKIDNGGTQEKTIEEQVQELMDMISKNSLGGLGSIPQA